MGSRPGLRGPADPRLSTPHTRFLRGVPEPAQRRDSDRTSPRRLAGDAVSIFARRADREYPRRLRTAALSQRRDAPGRFQPGGGRRQCADFGRSRDDEARPRWTEDRGRDAHCWAPPARIRTSPIRASGSNLGSLTAKHVPYAAQRLGHAHPALGPVRALLVRVSLGPCPSLHRLRNRQPSFVRRLHSYYDRV